MKTGKQYNGFTIVEMMMSLVILAMLMTAVALAFDASVTNFQTNDGIAKTMNTARAALMRITTELRSAQTVDVPSSTECTLTTSDPDGSNRNISYRFEPDEKVLYLDDTDNGESYPLCKNVSAATFTRSVVTGTGVTRNVRIVLTLTDNAGKVSQTLAAAAVIRKNSN